MSGGERKAGRGGAKTATHRPGATPAARSAHAAAPPPATALPLFPPQLAAWYSYMAHTALSGGVAARGGPLVGAAAAGCGSSGGGPGGGPPLQPDVESLLAAAGARPTAIDAAAAAAAAVATQGWAPGGFSPMWGVMDPSAIMYMHYAFSAQAAAAAAGGGGGVPTAGFHPFCADGPGSSAVAGLLPGAMPSSLMANPTAFARSLALRRQAALQTGAGGVIATRPIPRRSEPPMVAIAQS